jgi:hypothetical protein
MPTTPRGQNPPLTPEEIAQRIQQLNEQKQQIMDSHAKKIDAFPNKGGMSATDQRRLQEINDELDRLGEEQTLTGEELDQRDKEAAGSLTGEELDARDRERTMTGEELDAWDRQRRQATESDEMSAAEPGGTGSPGGGGSGDGGTTGEGGGVGSGSATGGAGGGSGTGGDGSGSGTGGEGGGGGTGGDGGTGTATSEGADDNPHGTLQHSGAQPKLTQPARQGVGDGVTDPAAEGGPDDNPLKPGLAAATPGAQVVDRVSAVTSAGQMVQPHSDPRVTDPTGEG